MLWIFFSALFLPAAVAAVLWATHGRVLFHPPLRIALGLALIPTVLFSGFGFLASFEGSSWDFVAFRIVYLLTGFAGLTAMACFLFGGFVPPPEAEGKERVR